jgi:glyoxylase-like metal-dependent hydrolase (beta-lactamase superfamily II)
MLPIETTGSLTQSERLKTVSQNVFVHTSTCNVYILRNGNSAVLVDFGDGSVLDILPSLGIEQVTDVLMTHHHRDQGQGLPLAQNRGPLAQASDIRLWVPAVERDLFSDVDVHWQGRDILNNYNVRQDRFSLLEPVPVAGVLEDYGRYFLGGFTFEVLPTPGHTTGSITLLVEADGSRLAFSGDLIAGPGKVWSMAATQWSYNGQEGAVLSCLSLEKLKEKQPDLLLPSHGKPMLHPADAIDLLFHRLRALLDERGENPRMQLLMREPYRAITPHLLLNQTSMANSYILVSESGKALAIDFGYDFIGGAAPGQDRASRRPWLYTLPALKRDFDVTQVDAAIPTHYHDDHVAGLNLLQRVEGTRLWIPENFAPILANPRAYDLPCLWYDPILADRVLPIAEPVAWEEYMLHLYPLPGHTLHAVAILVEVDGRRMLFTGDQYQGEQGLKWNYVYQNRFRIDDYRETAALYERLAPDLILSGHWSPLPTNPEYFLKLREQADVLAQLHRDLLPLEEVDLGAEGVACRITPYQAQAKAGEEIHFQVSAFNPLPEPTEICLEWIAPPGWLVIPDPAAAQPMETMASGVEFQANFIIRVPADALPARRVRLAVDVTAGSLRLGQQAECLIDLI